MQLKVSVSEADEFKKWYAEEAIAKKCRLSEKSKLKIFLLILLKVNSNNDNNLN
jgi:hypothetical protein